MTDHPVADLVASSPATRAEVCVTACADAWRGDGEILASPFGTIPMLGARVARLTFEQDLVLTDGEAGLMLNTPPVAPFPASSGGPASGGPASGGPASSRTAPDYGPVLEAWMPFRRVFDTVWSGRRHIMMMASQVDAYGNQNLSAIGDWARPKVQLIGVRGSPGNTINHTTSYWVPNHSKRTFVEHVDMVCGVGYDRARGLGIAARFHDVRCVVSNLGVFDFETPDHSMRLRSVHPGVTVEEVMESTGFDLTVGGGGTGAAEPPETRMPTPEELDLIRGFLDPAGARDREIQT
jgi:acyl CoA:acetate/3-ketoacid CoA transferase beta subunit